MDQGQTVGKHWDKRYCCIHLWKKLSATFYSLATVIHIIPHEKYTAPFLKTPKVSSQYSISL